MKKYTEYRDGKNVIPLRNSICGVDMPHWKLVRANDNESFLIGDAVDMLAAYENAETSDMPSSNGERMTERLADGQAVMNCSNCKLNDNGCNLLACRNQLKNRLATYEDAEEQKRLVVLPEKLYGVYEWDVTGVRYYDGEVTAYCVKNAQVESIIYASEIGKTVFLSREEAEAALKGGRNDV